MKKIERILKYIENQGDSVSAFERRSGLSYSYLSKTYDRGAEITLKFLKKIQENIPEEYYKIFPEEKEGSKGEGENPSVAGTSFAPPEIAKLQSEIEMLKIMLEGKEELINSLQMVIELQKKLLREAAKGNDDNGENDSGISQTKRSG